MAGSHRAQGNLNIAKKNKQTKITKEEGRVVSLSYNEMRLLAKYNESSMYSATEKTQRLKIR